MSYQFRYEELWNELNDGTEIIFQNKKDYHRRFWRNSWIISDSEADRVIKEARKQDKWDYCD